jgi:polyhydroxyalkanoate synthesis regulator phasin
LLSLAGEDKSWSKDEIEQLIDSLMERMTGKVSDDKESSESADKLSGALDDHQKVIKDFTDTVTGEISEMKESVVKLQNTSYLPSGYTGLSTGSGFGRIG